MTGRARYGGRSRLLIYLAAALSLGHHADHVIRGNHIGWPLTEQPTPFTYSLLVYPLILLGLFMSRAGRANTGYWLLLSGPGAVFLSVVHFGPAAVEPPADIIGEYASPLAGWLAFGWLLALIAALVVLFVHEAFVWRHHRQEHRTA
jgi:hypothetical protein